MQSKVLGGEFVAGGGLLIVAQYAMAVAAEDDNRIVKFLTGDMVPFKASPIRLATLRATRNVRPEPF